ncbi:hypothetical protein ACFL1X_09925 [Candidatus Hydrogenedentota bacterium]
MGKKQVVFITLLVICAVCTIGANAEKGTHLITLRKRIEKLEETVNLLNKRLTTLENMEFNNTSRPIEVPRPTKELPKYFFDSSAQTPYYGTWGIRPPFNRSDSPPERITQEQYEQIKNGMFFTQVLSILGPVNLKVHQYNYDTIDDVTAAFQVGPDDDSQILVRFIHNRVMLKTKTGK